MPRILVLGNSISAQRSGYLLAAEQVLSGRQDGDGIEIVNSSLGGVGTLGLLALFDRLVLVPRADEVLIESSASDAAGATPLQDLEWSFDQLLQRAAALQPERMTVLHLGRMDVSAEHHESVVRAQFRIAERHGACNVDLRSVVDRDAFTDGVHLNARGSKEIGERVAKHLEEVAPPVTRPTSRSPLSVEFVPVADMRWDARGADEARFRAALPTVRLDVGQHAVMDLGGSAPVALVVIVGPSSGVVRLSGDVDSRSMQWRDAWCDMRRIQVVHVPLRLRGSSMLRIEPTSDPSAAMDAWGMPTTESSAPAIAELVGILLRRTPSVEGGTHVPT